MNGKLDEKSEKKIVNERNKSGGNKARNGRKVEEIQER